MTLNGYKFEFSPKFALLNLKRICQVAAQVRILSQMCLVELLTHSLGGGTVARNPCVSPSARLTCFFYPHRDNALFCNLNFKNLEKYAAASHPKFAGFISMPLISATHGGMIAPNIYIYLLICLTYHKYTKTNQYKQQAEVAWKANEGQIYATYTRPAQRLVHKKTN